MKIFYDKQGNWQAYAKWQDEVVAKEPTTFFFAEVDKVYFNTLYIDGRFVAITESEEEVKRRALANLYNEFVAKRDGITWVVHDTGERYGYDRQAEDITNFLAAKEVAAVAGSVTYKVHLSETEKGLKEHTVDMLNKALLQSSKEQIAAYKEFELKRAEIKSGGV